MPPNVRITKEEILRTALEIVRQEGVQALNARNVATALGCSTQPVFSNFATMEQLHLAVAQQATCLVEAFIRQEVESGKYPPYKASGMAYIRFAKEERELFKLLYMCDREGSTVPESSALNDAMETLVHRNTGLSGDSAQLFHLEMWAFVHGIATMFATNFLDLDWELVSSMLTDAYLGLRKQYATE